MQFTLVDFSLSSEPAFFVPLSLLRGHVSPAPGPFAVMEAEIFPDEKSRV